MRKVVRRKEVEKAIKRLRGTLRTMLKERRVAVGRHWGLYIGDNEGEVFPVWGDSAYFYNSSRAIELRFFYNNGQIRRFLRRPLNEIMDEVLEELARYGVKVVA